MKGPISAAHAAYVKFADNPVKAGELLEKAEQRTKDKLPSLIHDSNLGNCWAGVRVGLYWAANNIIPQGASVAEWRSMLRNKL